MRITSKLKLGLTTTGPTAIVDSNRKPSLFLLSLELPGGWQCATLDAINDQGKVQFMPSLLASDKHSCPRFG